MHRKIRLKSHLWRCLVCLWAWCTDWKRNLDYLRVFVHVEGPDKKKCKPKHTQKSNKPEPTSKKKSFEKSGVCSFLKEIWLLSDHLCGISCFPDKVFWCPHGNGSNFLFPCPSKTFLGTAQGLVWVLPWKDINILALSQEHSSKD